MAPMQKITMLVLLALLAACSGPQLQEDFEPGPPTFASPPATEGVLAEVALAVQAEHGEDQSGFHLLDSSKEGLVWRLALIDSSVSSLDIQTYLWYPDISGRLLLDRVIRAADRGVRVRLIVDDLLTIGLDQALVEVERHPNIEFRIFNPWQDRALLSRGRDMLRYLERLNTRMHDKLLIADGRAAIVGGRNVGDHYFGLSHDYSFHDLDVLGFGALAVQSNDMFDHFWNSDWVVSVASIDLEEDQAFARDTLANLRKIISEAPELGAFPRLPKDWRPELEAIQPRLHPGRSELIFDETQGDAIAQNVMASLWPLMNRAQEELLITNAYIIPGQPGLDFVDSLTERGVDVRILTNSLASHDVPAVNSHYKDWRDDFLEAGVALHEFRADAAVRSLIEVPPVQGEFVGLHTKAFVIDRKLSFIGSMNFDPRSANINTEAGAFIESEGLAEELAQLMLRDMTPENAWQVHFDEDRDIYWVNSEETVTRQPARGSMQRLMDIFFKMFPKEQY